MLFAVKRTTSRHTVYNYAFNNNSVVAFRVCVGYMKLISVHEITVA